MRIVKILILTILFVNIIEAQKHDYIWNLSSRANTPNPEIPLSGMAILDFNPSLSKISITENYTSQIEFYLSNNSISDKDGNYIFSYNGFHIEDAAREIMPNSDSLSESGSSESGEVMAQAGLVLPYPGSENLFVLFHISSDVFYVENVDTFLGGRNLYYSLIDMDLNEGFGEVVSKKNLILSDTLDFGKMTATKHANGLDWWVIIPGGENDKYHRVLLTRDGPQILESQSMGVKNISGSGQSAFSQNGQFYAKYSSLSVEAGCFLYLYDFDRCTGYLSSPREHNYEVEGFELGSVAFSPNNKIMYLMAYTEIYQFDLTNDDIMSTKTLVAERNDFLDTIGNTGFIVRHNFYMSQLAPDNKIYITPWPNLRVITTIDYPDVWGEGCKVNQASIISPALKSALPLYPNYRLGPLEGSPCDTLGIVNLPLSRWRADQSEEDYLEFRMVDVSDYEPTEWFWDFGDGNTSDERNPTHSFSQNGTYEICLTVSNVHGSDTSCETFQVGSTSISEEELEIAVSVYPNPVQEDLFIDIGGYYPGEARIIIYDIQGRQVKEQRVYHGSNYVYVGNFAAGMYVYKIEDGGLKVKVGKVTKI